ncbi:hypothetical protein H1P_1030004 [Hyella patelloides LEGE 07179]|uniref:Transposase n=1 Tax=Hyella patelloides LEGE 07179 TaxID=945734 RepID=A0A563VJA7_9CYAN|nr:hypothetical protein H1P_1030004 [Hyella patelloides LEGE 07179]
MNFREFKVIAQTMKIRIHARGLIMTARDALDIRLENTSNRSFD